MCGRYSQSKDPAKLASRFGADSGGAAIRPHANIAPGQEAPVVIVEEAPGRGGRRVLRLLRWGLIPSWAKDPAIGHRLFNARGETLAQKPSFRTPFFRRRCLVPADAFYEWRKNPLGRGKTPYRIALKSGEPFAMAGLWDRWVGPEGRAVSTFAIITTEANEALRPVHDRMPVILDPPEEETWLNPDSEFKGLMDLLNPYPGELMKAHEVSHDASLVFQEVRK